MNNPSKYIEGWKWRNSKFMQPLFSRNTVISNSIFILPYYINETTRKIVSFSMNSWKSLCKTSVPNNNLWATFPSIPPISSQINRITNTLYFLILSDYFCFNISLTSQFKDLFNVSILTWQASCNISITSSIKKKIPFSRNQ